MTSFLSQFVLIPNEINAKRLFRFLNNTIEKSIVVCNNFKNAKNQ